MHGPLESERGFRLSRETIVKKNLFALNAKNAILGTDEVVDRCLGLYEGACRVTTYLLQRFQFPTTILHQYLQESLILYLKEACV